MKLVAIHWKPGPIGTEAVDISVFREYVDAAVWMDGIRPIKVETFDVRKSHSAIPVLFAQGETGPGFFAVFRAPTVGKYDYQMDIENELSCRWKRSAAQNTNGTPVWDRLPNDAIRVSA